LYLDVCCLNRPLDDQSQERVRLEAEAVAEIMDRVKAGTQELVTSAILQLEISRNPNADKRVIVQKSLSLASTSQPVGDNERDRAAILHALGFQGYDAWHIACAEAAGAAVFLTTDDQLLRRAKRLGHKLHVRIVDPVNWLKEASS
jgi:predicted nucleic acid-binding protein